MENAKPGDLARLRSQLEQRERVEGRRRRTLTFGQVEERLRSGEVLTAREMVARLKELGADARMNDVASALNALVRRGWVHTARHRGTEWFRWSCAGTCEGPCRAWRVAA